MYFLNRKEAGKLLARELISYQNSPDTLVLGLPRGGVPVAFEIASILRLPLDIMVVRKLGVPGHEELAMGALATGQVQVLNEGLIRSLGISQPMIDAVAEAEHRELTRRSRIYRNGRPAPDLKGKTVILIDDGIATGANMRAATEAAKKQHAARVVVAAPIAADSALIAIRACAHEVVCLNVPKPFYGVGDFYINFQPPSDAEVKALLRGMPQESFPPAHLRRHA